MGDEVWRASRVIAVPTSIDVVTLLGPRGTFLRVLEDRLAMDIHVRGSQMTMTEEPGDVTPAVKILAELITIIRTDQGLSEKTVERVINLATGDLKSSEILTADIISTRGRTVRPKTLNQKRYVDATNQHTVVLGIGPTGTDKTYLAMARAVQALQPKQVSRIIPTRPAIKAGKWLGFLPGILNDKIDPCLWPLCDALHDTVEADSVPKLLISSTIEVAPPAYIRGRILNNAFIILDETQSTSSEQMEMFLIRLGFGSKVVVTSDIAQIDLPDGVRSGSRQVTQILDNVEDVAFCTFTAHDVVHHKLVGRIVAAYNSYDNIQQGRSGR